MLSFMMLICSLCNQLPLFPAAGERECMQAVQTIQCCHAQPHMNFKVKREASAHGTRKLLRCKTAVPTMSLPALDIMLLPALKSA